MKRDATPVHGRVFTLQAGKLWKAESCTEGKSKDDVLTSDVCLSDVLIVLVFRSLLGCYFTCDYFEANFCSVYSTVHQNLFLFFTPLPHRLFYTLNHPFFAIRYPSFSITPPQPQYVDYRSRQGNFP